MKTQLDPEELNLVTLAADYSNEDEARALLERMRWPDGPACPHCRNHSEKPIYALTGKPDSKTPVRKGVYKCGACRKQFTVLVNTIFSDSHIPIGKWLMAMFIICSSKKSISAHQLHRMLGVTYKTAWFMAHRIRHAMAADENTPKLSGAVESDETYVGGVGDPKTKVLRHTPVIALVQRGGPMRTAVVSNVTQNTLGKALAECVSKTATVHTDEHPAYRKPLKQWAQHHAVNHSKYEYARRLPDGSTAHVNTCESFFSLLKRGVQGAWHHVSREHLPKYASEFEFRWNTREMTDGERLEQAVLKVEGKRLKYRQAI